MICDHTLYHADESGRLLGSWATERVGPRTRIFCSGCGKFYAYLPGKGRQKAVNEPLLKENGSQPVQR